MSLTFIFPVSALDNIETGNIIVNGVGVTTSTSFPFDTPITLPYGQNHLIRVDYDSYDYYESYLELTGSFTITISQNVDLYFGYNAQNTSNISYDVIPQTGIEEYRDESKDFTQSNTLISSSYYVFYDGDHDSISVSTTTFSDTYTVGYKCYSNVPAGTYNIEYQHYHLPSSGDFTGDFILALYAVDTTPIYPQPPVEDDKSIIDGFKDGTYTFEQSLEMLIENMQTVLDDQFTSVAYKHFYVDYTSAMIEILEKESDIIYNATVSDFNEEGEQIVNEYESSGIVDPTEYINRLQMLFTDVLSQATSPEQGSFLSSVFQNLLAKLQLAFDVSYKAELDNTISDSQLETDKGKQNNLISKYFEEDELRKKFSQAEFDALSDWRTWLDDIGDYTSYRSIFNYIFTEFGIISTIVQIPFTFMIVALLLGTAINRSSSHHSRKEVEKNSEIRTVDE